MGKKHRVRRTKTILKDKLSKLPKDSVVKIGSRNCYIYAYYNNELTNERLCDIDKKNMDQLNRLILKNTIRGKTNVAFSYQKKLENYKPILERYVVKCFKSDIELNTYIIIITGSELGNYWNIDEYAYKNKLYIAPKDRHYPQERLEVKRLNYGY